MKFLVVGRRPETRALSQALAAREPQGTRYFSEGRTAAAALRRKDEVYDFVFLEEGSATPGGREAIRAIRERNPHVPIAALSFSETDLPSERAPRLIGLFERTRQGLRVRNCRLETTIVTDPETLPPEAGEILFEYHAPCRKRGRTHDDRRESESS